MVHGGKSDFSPPAFLKAKDAIKAGRESITINEEVIYAWEIIVGNYGGCL